MRHLHKLVWDFRAEMEGSWPTPGTLDSLRFAATEAAEAMDARLRCDPKWKRNHINRRAQVELELADCALMLLTAIGPEYKEAPSGDDYAIPNLDQIMYQVAYALVGYKNLHCTWEEGLPDFWKIMWLDELHYALRSIDAYMGNDESLEYFLVGVMDSLRKKHKE